MALLPLLYCSYYYHHAQGMLALADIQARVSQFVEAGLPLLVTTACLLVDKARLLPHSTFVVSQSVSQWASEWAAAYV